MIPLFTYIYGCVQENVPVRGTVNSLLITVFHPRTISTIAKGVWPNKSKVAGSAEKVNL